MISEYSILALSAAVALSGAIGCASNDDDLAQSSGGGFMATATGAGNGWSSSVAVTSGFGGHVVVTPPPPPEDPCAPKPNPPEVPDGWTDSLGWSCKCRFYEPPSKDALPPPIQWQPCPDVGDGLACQSMAINWGNGTQESYIAFEPTMDRNPDGSAVLQFVRSVNKSYSIHLVADADGPVRTANYFVWGNQSWGDMKCHPDDQGINEGRFITHIRGTDIDEWEDWQGAWGGSIDDLHPRILSKYPSMPQAYQHGWRASKNGVVRLADSVLSFYPWSMLTETFITSPAVDPEHLRAAYVVVRNGGDFFWGTSTLYRSGINVWDPVGGARPFVRWPGDSTRGAGNFGTDGVDMVWCQGEGKAPNEKVFPTRSIMTGPFTTDPTKLEPRRLRSLPTSRISGAPAKVGCGHAALEGPAGDLIITRLSDGWSWYIPQTSERRLHQALGLTCTELFVAGNILNRFTIARVRLDSLGPGFAPD